MITKQRLWELLHLAKPGDRFAHRLNIFLLSLIALNIVAVILESVDWIRNEWAKPFQVVEVFSVSVFTMEYLGRFYSCVADPRFKHPIKGRLRYLAQPMALIDLIAVLPFYLPFVGADLRFVRIFRLFRIFRVAKLGRYSTSWKMIARVLRKQREELILCILVMMLLIVLSASVMYFVENDAQPQKFSDIPSAMWWAVATLTTVGYGDIYPITPTGKLIASFIEISGIAFFALPAAVIGAGLIEELRERRRSMVCPHCGRDLN